ncbi:MAG TPA: SGNH/GDSL hydrolase family protein [Marmoricola sp.]|nr:SGNH/GDSL hydrolase family protein [Marmoricola sp.]
MAALPLTKFLQHGRPADASRVVVCAGDSTTQGKASGDWVGLLHDELGPRGYAVVNAGVSGALSCTLLRELDGVIAARPDVVTVMIGTNDVMATTSEQWRASYQRQQPPETPTLESYRRWLDEIVRRLTTETEARVALLEVPPISEQVDSVFNQRVDSFNDVVRDVAARHEVAVLPVNARLKELIAASSAAPPFDGTARDVKSALLQHFLLRRGWDRIAARAGRVALTDNIHLTDRAAGEIAALVRKFVDAGPGPEPTTTVGP